MFLPLLLSLLFVLLAGWLVWHFLAPQLPASDPVAERAFLRGKVVWITGASSGIGRALAEHLRVHASEGVKVVLSARNEASLTAVAGSLQAAGLRDVFVLPLDLEKLSQEPALADAAVAAVLERFPGCGIDIVIHNGGVSMRGGVAQAAFAVDQRLLNINFLGAVSLTKAVLPGMLERRSGHILAVSSVQGKLPLAFRSAYAASKHALHAWMLSLRQELLAEGSQCGVHVGVLSPGYVATNLSLNALRADGGAHGIMDATTARGFAPAFVAQVAYDAIRLRRADTLVADATARVGLMLYALAPRLLDKIMVKRARKERASLLQEEQQAAQH